VAKETKQKKEATARDEALESEHEPEIDEMWRIVRLLMDSELSRIMMCRRNLKA
jgi:hypothetical protein